MRASSGHFNGWGGCGCILRAWQHTSRHWPFPHPKLEPLHRCPNPQRKMEGTDMLLLFSRAKLHELQLPSEDSCLHTFFSSGLFLLIQINLPRSSALQKIHSEFQELPVCQIDNSVAGGILQRLAWMLMTCTAHPKPKVMEVKSA